MLARKKMGKERTSKHFMHNNKKKLEKTFALLLLLSMKRFTF